MEISLNIMYDTPQDGVSRFSSLGFKVHDARWRG